MGRPLGGLSLGTKIVGAEGIRWKMKSESWVRSAAWMWHQDVPRELGGKEGDTSVHVAGAGGRMQTRKGGRGRNRMSGAEEDAEKGEGAKEEVQNKG